MDSHSFGRGLFLQLDPLLGGKSSIEPAIAGVLLKLAPREAGAFVSPIAGFRLKLAPSDASPMAELLLKLAPRDDGGVGSPIAGVLLKLAPRGARIVAPPPRGGVLLQLAPRVGDGLVTSVTAGVLFQLASSGLAVPPSAGVLFQLASRSTGAFATSPTAGVLFQQDPVGTGPCICLVSTTTKFTVASSSVISVLDISVPMSREVKCCPMLFTLLISGRKHASETAVMPKPTSITVRLIIGADMA